MTALARYHQLITTTGFRSSGRSVFFRHCAATYCMFSTIIRLLECASSCGNSIHLPSGETGIAPIHHGADFSSE
jgi:hypothetical protein